MDELLSRSIAQILPSKEEFARACASGKRLRIYIGADATGPQLHLGHATNFIWLEKMRRLGHETYILFGDFTAMIGDPTDKSAARVRLTQEQVEAHIATWKEQVAPILSFDDPVNPAHLVRNAEWLRKLSFAEVLDLASNFTVQQMLERDMFARRIEEKKPIYVHEFFYPLMQGYDSVHLDVDVELGGTDQTFNMLVGRTLQKKYRGKEKFVISTTLLTNPSTGKKLMSKSEGGYIALNDPPNDMYGKVMALPDATIMQMFLDCTFVPLAEIAALETGLHSGVNNPRDVKMRLAEEITAIYHGPERAAAARDYFVQTFQKKETPTDLPEVLVPPGAQLSDVLLAQGFVASKSDFKRLVSEGAITFCDGEVTDFNFVLDKEGVVRVGKRKFLRVVIS